MRAAVCQDTLRTNFKGKNLTPKHECPGGGCAVIRFVCVQDASWQNGVDQAKVSDRDNNTTNGAACMFSSAI